MKKLPKVIRRDLGPTPGRAGTRGGQATATPAEEPTSVGGEPPEVSTARVERATEQAKRSTEPAKRATEPARRATEQAKRATEQATGPAEQAKGPTEEAATPVETAAAPAAPANLPQPRSNDDLARRRRALAYRMIERYSVYAGGAGIIPMPAVSLGGVMGVNVRMVQILCKMYGVPFERDRARAIVVGLVGGATPVGIAAATASTLALFTPATNVIALAVSSAMAIACTRRIGRVFVDRFETGRGIE